TVVNPRALEVADSLDREFARTGRFVGPLHGIPVIVKDNFDTYDLPTTAGSASLAGSIPPDDAYMVRRRREAGAIVLARSNTAAWAFGTSGTEGCGTRRCSCDPCARRRVRAGSGGGPAVAVAASPGAVGPGRDPGNSHRARSSCTARVGVRRALGLTSRDG